MGQVERFCNAVAAELRVPLTHLRNEFNPGSPLADELDRLARLYRVSTLVVLRRIFDAEFGEPAWLSWGEYDGAYSEQMSRIARAKGPSGGNFYNTRVERARFVLGRL